jgi:histidyl-tRNA synthetase
VSILSIFIMSAKTQPARGMRDFLPADVRRRNYVINTVREVYERYGFEPLETPAVENIETLLGKYGEEGNQLIFKILRRGEHEKTGQADLALRYDLTVPLARVVAEYRNELPKFFKRYQIQPVWRADRPARGRFREFYQCDVDICGSRSMVVEAETFAAVSDVLTRLGFNDFTIRLNHRKLLADIVRDSGIPDEKTTDALVALDKLDKIGRDNVEKELIQRGVTPEAAEIFLAFFEGFAGLEEAVSKENKIGFDAFNNAFLTRWAEGFDDANSANEDQVLKELRQIIALSEQTSAAAHIKIDPSLARGLSYYTGAIMEITVPDLAGSLGGGGRYDNLVSMFSGQDVPACGFSLGLERIIVVMAERGMFPRELTATPADVMVTLWNADSAADALALAGELRGAGLRVDVYPDADKLGKQFKYASARGIPYVCVVGDTEREQGAVNLKNMVTGEQQTIARAELGEKLALLAQEI